MKYLCLSLFISMALLAVLAACAPQATPIIELPLSSGPLQVKPTVTPTPGLIILPPPGVKPLCAPPATSIDQITSFCANAAAGQGGITFYYHPDQNAMIFPSGSDVACSYSANKATCSGAQNEQFQEVICTSCGEGGTPDTFGDFVCSKDYVKDAQGYCLPSSPELEYPLCGPAAHYDNALQLCIDDATQQPLALCPADHPYYLPDFHSCLAQAYPEVYNCQSFTVALGDCSISPNKPKGCNRMRGSCP